MECDKLKLISKDLQQEIQKAINDESWQIAAALIESLQKLVHVGVIDLYIKPNENDNYE